MKSKTLGLFEWVANPHSLVFFSFFFFFKANEEISLQKEYSHPSKGKALGWLLIHMFSTKPTRGIQQHDSCNNDEPILLLLSSNVVQPM